MKTEYYVEIMGLYEYGVFMVILCIALWYESDLWDSVIWGHPPSFYSKQHQTKKSAKPATNCTQITRKTQKQPSVLLSEVHFHIHNFILAFW